MINSQGASNTEELAIATLLNSKNILAFADDLKTELITTLSLKNLYIEIKTAIDRLGADASFDMIYAEVESHADKEEVTRLHMRSSLVDSTCFHSHLGTLQSLAVKNKHNQADNKAEKAHQDDDLIKLCINTPLAQYAAELAESAKMPRNTTFLSVLSIFSSVSCRFRSISYNHGGSQPLSMNFCGEQPPAAAKSRVLQHTQRPIVDQIRQKQKAVNKKIAKLKETLEAGELDKDESKAIKGEILEKRRELDSTFEFITDTTPEALDSSLQDSGGYFAIASAEQGAINSLLGITYGDGKSASNKDLVLKGFNAEWHNSKRKGRETYAGNVVGTITALAQTGMISNLLNASGNTGVIERFILWSEATLLGTRDHTQYHKINESIQQKFDNSIVNIYNGVSNADYNELLSLNITDRMWHKLHIRRNELEPTISESGENSASLLRGVIGKYDMFVMKIAANLHLSSTLEQMTINDDRVYEAMKIMDAYINHIKSLIAENVVEALSDRDNAILDFIGQKRKTGKQISDKLYRKKCFIKGGSMSRNTVYEQLDKLTRRGLVTMTFNPDTMSKSDAVFSID